MKTNDIFSRLNKKSDVPVSLFPCSWMHRTSMRIGRATPMGSVNMFQGNRIELDAKQLTRFATLERPVMNNYEVNLGFFFVPWTAHDEMGTSAWFRKNFAMSNDSNKVTLAQIMRDYKLNANEYFNPAFDNALRHHPLMVAFKRMGNIKLVGSLYDHLGYYIAADFDPNTFTKFYSYDLSASTPTGVKVSYEDFITGAVSWKVAGTGGYVNSKIAGVAANTTFTGGNVGIMPMDMYCIYKYYLGQDVYGLTLTQLSTKANLTVDSRLVHHTHLALGLPVGPSSQPGSWEDYYGSLKPADVVDSYAEYVKAIAAIDSEGDFELNCLDWLNYMRIYADWFLNDHYTRRDDFLDMIGVAYYGAAKDWSVSSNTYGIPKLFTAGTAATSWGSIGNGKLYSNPELDFFAEYIRKGECLPVLWELNRMTAQRCEIDMKGLAGTSMDINTAATTGSVADTPVGSSIREHFFNRAVQKFKDLISRVGYDFRDNTRALYGKGVSDSTLNRSQLIAIKTFAVQIGDVQQTSESSVKGTLGDFGGFAIAKDGTDTVSWTAEQNGTFMVLAWVRPRNVAFASGVDREKMKNDYFDYLLPQFGGVGYQDVLLSEVKASAANGTLHNGAKAALGKEEIYSEYMSRPNMVTGNMRTFNRVWHSDRFFSQNPVLGKSLSPKFLYITEDDDVNRIFSNYIDDPIVCTCYFHGNITRQLPSRIKTDF